jgi:hypothetical protein
MIDKNIRVTPRGRAFPRKHDPAYWAGKKPTIEMAMQGIVPTVTMYRRLANRIPGDEMAAHLGFKRFHVFPNDWKPGDGLARVRTHEEEKFINSRVSRHIGWQSI